MLKSKRARYYAKKDYAKKDYSKKDYAKNTYFGANSRNGICPA